MTRFHIIDDAVAILRSRGVYKQAKLYARQGQLYAGHGSGFIMLFASGGTSLPNVSWEEADADFAAAVITPGKTGRLMVAFPTAVTRIARAAP